MKLRLTLAAKIGLWLILNLVLLGGVALGVLISTGGLNGWIERTAGDRFRGVADVLMAELNQEDAAGRERLLEGYAADYGLTFAVYYNDGTQVAGPTRELPEIVARQMRPPPAENRPPRRDGNPPPPRQGDGLRPPPPQAAPPPRPAANRGEVLGRDGRILVRTDDPAEWWMGARVPVTVRPGGPPRPGTLFASSESALSFGALFDLRPILWAVGIVVIVSVVFWLPLVVGITRALRALQVATGRIAEGKFDTRVPATRGDEIGRLGESVNVMAARLQMLVDGQKKFLADVAHELGSPIGRLQLGTHILEERVPAEMRSQVEDVREEVEQMGALVGELLDFTQADLGGEAVAMEAVRLAEVVRCVVAREAREMDVRVAVAEDLDVCANLRLLERALANLVRNAKRHGGPDVRLEITAQLAADHGVELILADDGPGVPPAALEHLGEPFYRPDAARQRETGGTGLGLSIVRTVIAAMGGNVRFRNRSPHGFEVVIELRTEAADFTRP